ncbi:MAG: hypothetical protein FH749_12685 [Firmicutes bacterium]|nr:hypothetical protein [Bacillota bacterium]
MLDIKQLAVVVPAPGGPPNSALPIFLKFLSGFPVVCPKGRDARLRGLEKFLRYTGGEVLKNKDVWLIDDVFTTSGTAAACTEKLLSAGVRLVAVLVLGN